MKRNAVTKRELEIGKLSLDGHLEKLKVGLKDDLKLKEAYKAA